MRRTSTCQSASTQITISGKGKKCAPCSRRQARKASMIWRRPPSTGSAGSKPSASS
jgi:hypothetical protein